MIKIQKVSVKRFRSILNLKFNIDTSNNFITICGENNSGKTNTLRAINLFFRPKTYNAKEDSPTHKYEGTRGAKVYPEIQIAFIDSKNDLYTITRIFNQEGLLESRGHKLINSSKQKKVNLTEKEIISFLNKIAFYFLETINISFPELISSFINEIYDVQYARSRFRGLKADLKKSYDNYIKGLLTVLDDLGKDISPKFQEYKKDWKVSFDINQDIKRFRDLINQDVEFYINDKSNKIIENKGAGLQRLAHILLHFKIIEKIKKRSPILLIDEPNTYLHQGLQIKLLKDMLNIKEDSQLFITTHENMFIDSYTLNNVFLLELKLEDKFFKRKGKNYGVLDTCLVDLNEVEGARKIREYLGISNDQFDILDNYNILVEGESDKVYLSELIKYFKLPLPNIKFTEGADNIPKFLGFYNAFYQNKDIKPKILIILDNDSKGREIYNKLFSKSYPNLDVKPIKIKNHLGEESEVRSANNEIEDFIYPKLVCKLTNEILKKRSFNKIDQKRICHKIDQPAHKNNGILQLIENEKNESNPDQGQEMKIDSESFKKSLAKATIIEGNSQIIKIIKEENIKYPEVKKMLEKISKPFD